jgi:hypothetical protein
MASRGREQDDVLDYAEEEYGEEEYDEEAGDAYDEWARDNEEMEMQNDE